MVGDSYRLLRLAELRGEPIRVIDIGGIPCEEISDSHRLCRQPLVSVAMITYNHARFVRRAIESVVSQKTDFPFELVIGEDCSTDETRAIVLACQQAYPEVIRVLHAPINVGASANGLRVDQRCRGRYLAYCEGDDYWIDPCKLQEQVRILEQDANIGMVFCSGKVERDGVVNDVPVELGFGEWPDDADLRLKLIQGGRIITCGLMVRTADIQAAERENVLLRCEMTLGDLTYWLEALKRPKWRQIHRAMVVYVLHPQSACATNITRILRDAALVRYWYCSTVPDLRAYANDMLHTLVFRRMYVSLLANVSRTQRRRLIWELVNFARREKVSLTLKEAGLLAIGYFGLYDLQKKLRPRMKLWLR